MSTRRRVTQAELEEIRRLHDEEGMTFRPISERFGRYETWAKDMYNYHYGRKSNNKKHRMCSQELPLRTIAGTFYQMPIKAPRATCSGCIEESNCKDLVMTGDPVRCEWPLEKEVSNVHGKA